MDHTTRPGFTRPGQSRLRCPTHAWARTAALGLTTSKGALQSSTTRSQHHTRRFTTLTHQTHSQHVRTSPHISPGRTRAGNPHTTRSPQPLAQLVGQQLSILSSTRLSIAALSDRPLRQRTPSQVALSSSRHDPDSAWNGPCTARPTLRPLHLLPSAWRRSPSIRCVRLDLARSSSLSRTVTRT